MPLAVGDRAPDFSLKDQNNQDVSLSGLLARGPVLIVFYPFAFTGICTAELTAVEIDPIFNSDPVTTVTISCDSPFSLKVFAEREGFHFRLLSDFWPHGAVAAAFGVFNDEGGSPNRGTFLVDRDATITFAEMNGRGQGRDPQRWRDAIAALSP